ncbi:MAG TPA: HAD-IA family hydrolase [Burkholderiales bacterium]|nr:HAD-IA family hydrolase [Burkholderiales bacterium]
MTPNIEALIFDLGGVVMNVDFEQAFDIWSRHSGVAAPLLRSRFIADVAYERHERGELTTDEYFESLRASLGVALSNSQLAEGWNAVLGHEIPGMRDLLCDANEHRPLYLFSNTNRIHQICWTEKLSATLRLFRKCFTSCEMGLRKPELQAFAAVAAAIGVPPRHILFFDDLADNIAGARRAGMQAVHVQSVGDVRNALAELQQRRHAPATTGSF